MARRGGVLPQDLRAQGKEIVRYSREEIAKQMLLVEQMLGRGFMVGQIVRLASKELNVSHGRITILIAKVRERFAREDSTARPTWKAEQIRRLMRQLQVAMGTQNAKGEWTVMPNMGAYTRIESLLADIQGTREPIEVNVDVSYTEAMMTVIGSMTPEHMDAVLERARERKRLAEAYVSEVRTLPQ